jgi:NAD(P)H-hydrate repair Nnr-like enzyme with NAD(P)H-hydrate dehydratase domain
MLSGIAGANLIRRQRIALIAAQAFTIGSQLARDPANAVLVPHVQEVKRLKSFKRRKKAAEAPGSPSSPATGTSGTPEP